MKKFFFALIAMIVTNISIAQNIGIETLEGKSYVEVDMSCESSELGKISIMLDQGSAKKFIKNLQKTLADARKMAATATQKGVKSYNKTMPGSYSYSKLMFENEDGTNVADHNYNNYLVPYFNVDTEGNSYVTLGGYYAGYNTSNMGSNYNKRNKFFFYVKIPVEASDKFCNDFDLAIADMNNSQKELDQNENLMASSKLSNQMNSKFAHVLSVITTFPYGLIIILVILGIVVALVYRKKKH